MRIIAKISKSFVFLNLKSIVILVLLIAGLGCNAQRGRLIVHDPVVIKEGNRYYLFATGHKISVWSSTDMKNWKPEPSVFTEVPEWTREAVPDFVDHIWAPDIYFHNGLYYLYYSISAFGKNTSCIGLAVNKTLNAQSSKYKWEDKGIVVQSVPGRDNWNAIDPNLVFDDANQAYLSFGSFWGGLKLVKLNEELAKPAEPQEWYTIARRRRSYEAPDINAGDAAIEAPFIFKHEGYYYLFASFDYCCRGLNSSYKVMVGRSKNISGPYLDKEGIDMYNGGGSLVWQGNQDWAAGGHNSAYEFEGTDYIVFHAYDRNDQGRPKLMIKKMTWDKQGWPVIAPK